MDQWCKHYIPFWCVQWHARNVSSVLYSYTRILQKLQNTNISNETRQAKPLSNATSNAHTLRMLANISTPRVGKRRRWVQHLHWKQARAVCGVMHKRPKLDENSNEYRHSQLTLAEIPSSAYFALAPAALLCDAYILANIARVNFHAQVRACHYTKITKSSVSFFQCIGLFEIRLYYLLVSSVFNQNREIME